MDHRDIVRSRILGIDSLSDFVHTLERNELVLDLYVFITRRLELEEADFLLHHYPCWILHGVARSAYGQSFWVLSIWRGTWLEVVGYSGCNRCQLGHHDLEQFELASMGMGSQQQMDSGIGRRNVDDINGFDHRTSCATIGILDV